MIQYNNIYNIAYKNIDSHINVLYAPTNNTFDLLVQLLDINISYVNSPASNYYYDLFWSNNFLDHTQQTIQLSRQLHLIDILWFHANPPLKFKKEDIALVRNQLQKSKKIFPDLATMKSWGFDGEDGIIIPYGIPTKTEFENIEKTESVLVMNPNNNQDIVSLYEHIKTAIPTAQTISSLQNINSIDLLYATMAKYKVIIDIYNPLNVLIAQYLGCKSITSTNQPAELKGITQLFNYSTINQVLTSVLNDALNDEDVRGNQAWIRANHNFDTVSNSINQILYTIKSEEFFVS